MARRGEPQDTPSEEAVEHDFSMPADSDLTNDVHGTVDADDDADEAQPE